MKNYKRHIIKNDSTIKKALIQLDNLGIDAILFVVNNKNELVGSITDGDIRRSLISNGFNYDFRIDTIIQPNPKFIVKGN